MKIVLRLWYVDIVGYLKHFLEINYLEQFPRKTIFMLSVGVKNDRVFMFYAHGESYFQCRNKKGLLKRGRDSG